MTRKFLLDEHFARWWRKVLPIICPEAELTWVGDRNSLPRGTQDPELLIWYEESDHFMITDNRRTMPRHLNDHLLAGRHIPGIFKVDPETNIHALAADMKLVIFAGRPEDFRDRIVKLPL